MALEVQTELTDPRVWIRHYSQPRNDFHNLHQSVSCSCDMVNQYSPHRRIKLPMY